MRGRPVPHGLRLALDEGREAGSEQLHCLAYTILIADWHR
jgi:hypothetical protein